MSQFLCRYQQAIEGVDGKKFREDVITNPVRGGNRIRVLQVRAHLPCHPCPGCLPPHSRLPSCGFCAIRSSAALIRPHVAVCVGDGGGGEVA
jgi:hypothetical protein